ncbi:MAG TPA: flagellar basal-body MS-ring/collar protein FliF [Chloroflexota bacterium]|nr:flagellar basal-body MS-ring/collar protein FliF [Chloroflexota bacterium]
MIQNAQSNLQRLWRQMTWAQRLSLLGVAGASVMAIAVLVLWANTPSYGVLFSGLSADDAGAITTQLTQSKIPYQLANGGTTILVPQDVVDNTRIQLASQGLPQGGVVGFSLFDKSNIFQGDSFTEQVNYQRALEGELTRTIGQISGIVYDRVNIVLPQQQLFSSQQTSPSASVLLKFAPGSTLSDAQIGGIQHLVASSVEGLKPDAVTVVDGNGAILSSNGSLDGAGASGLTALDAQTRYASNLEAQLTAMLETVLGPGRAVVHVSDTMDWTQRESTANTYAPQSAYSPITQSHVAEISSTVPSESAGGIPGLASNVPSYGTSGSISSSVLQRQRTADFQYANSETITKVVQAPGQITQLSVAVLLDRVSDPRTIAALRQAITSAVGLNRQRGDQLSISSVSFDQTAAAAATKAVALQQQRAFIVEIVRWAALIVVPLILLILLMRLLVPRRPKASMAEATVQVSEQHAPLLPAPDNAQPPAAKHHDMIRQSMAHLARENPEVVADVISRWIEEDRG